MMTATTRRFGTSDLAVAPVGMGTWPIGGARYGTSDDQTAIRAIHAALDAGVTCFDTAPSYGDGHAEALLGQALAGRREQATVVTKGGLIWDDASQVLGRNSRRDYLIERLDESLRRLQTDYVDVYAIHWPDAETPLADTMRAMEEIALSGRARHIGVSNFTGDQIREASSQLRTDRLIANQVSYHLFDDRWAKASFPACEELGMGAMAYGPLAHGLLSGTITRDTVFDASDWRASGMIFGQALLTPENREQNIAVVERLSAIAADLGTTLPRLAIAWVLSNPTVTVALCGARTEAEIIDSAAAMELRLNDEAVATIADAMSAAVGRSDELLT